MSFIEDTFQLPELCMGIRNNDTVSESTKIYPRQHKVGTGRFYFSATKGRTVAIGNTEEEAISNLTSILAGKTR
jgi:hypothetical protein